MSRAIDLHNHILHNIDDGPRTLEESVGLARSMVEAGYGIVVATPHVVEGEPGTALIESRLTELNNALAAEKIGLTVLPGAEHHIDPTLADRFKDGREKPPTLNNSRYILLELPFFQPLPPYTEELFFKLQLEQIRPIIPHPERAAALQGDHNLIKKLHDRGVLYQLTWGALTGRLGPLPQKTALYILDQGMADLFATDAHNGAGRLAEVERAVSELEKILGPGSAEPYLTGRPGLIINNKNFSGGR